MSAFIDSLAYFARNIAVFIIFTSFVGMILPNGKYRAYIDLLFGLILILLIAEPIIGFTQNGFGGGVSFETGDESDFGLYTEMQDELVAEALSAQIGLVLTDYEVLGADVTVRNGQVTAIEVWVRGRDDGGVNLFPLLDSADPIRVLLSGFYGVEEANIYVQRVR
jgi:stage III sporulation protein AF